jgi:anti-sigma regulatory factor (Ser/Thr protein kinase)
MTTPHGTGHLPYSDPSTERPRVLSLRWDHGELPQDRNARMMLVGRVHSAVRGVLDPLWCVAAHTAECAAGVLCALLANAFEHGQPPVSVLVDQGLTGALSIAVRDTGAGMPHLERGARSRTTHPSGLMLVDTLAQMWDVQEHPGADGRTCAKTVTAVIVASHEPAAWPTGPARRRKSGAPR